MSRTAISALVLACFLLAAAPAIEAQTTTGTIDGIIRDSDGRVLPGTMVVANSPSLIQADLTVFSDETGYYRMSLLLPGTYEVAFTLSGFRPVSRGDLVVRAGQTTEMSVTLEIAPVEETMVVYGEAPIIDARAARLAFTYAADVVENIPVPRTVNDIFYTVPGVEIMNNYGNVDQPGLVDVQNVLGTGERANDFRLDGANVTDPAGQWNMQMLMPFDVFEELQVVKSAKPAEIPYQGGLFNIITKSGGNDLHGEVGGYFTSDALQSSNTDHIQEEEGVQTSNKIVSLYEVTASLGGRIVRDKLWWFASARRNDGTSKVFGFSTDVDNTITGLSGKLTYQPSQEHRITATATAWNQHVSHFFFGFSPTLAMDANAAADRPMHGRSIGGHWSGILSRNLVTEVSISYADGRYYQMFQSGATEVPIVDLGTGQRWRNLGEGSRNQDTDSISLKGSLSWFVPEAAGRHDVKFGFEFLPTHMRVDFSEIEDHRLHTLFGRNFAVRFLTTPSISMFDNDTTSFYVQDAWSVTGRLTLNLGLRFMHKSVTTPETQAGGGTFAGTSVAARFPELNATTLPATELINWSVVEPRFAMAFALDSTGRTILRAGASQYHHNITAFDLFVSNPAFPYNFVTLWFDKNHDGAFQVGEDGPLMFSFGGQINPVDPDIKQAYSNEFIIGMSHEATQDWQVSANFIYRKDTKLWNTIDVGVPFSSYTPVEALDPGPDGVPGTGDDAMSTVYAQDPATIGQSQSLMTNPDGSDRTYKGLEVTVSKRLSNNWQAVASLVVSNLEVIKTTSANETAGLFDSPNNLINAEGLDPNNPPVQLKLQGTYMFDFGLVMSGFYRLASGYPYTRELTVVGLPQGPTTIFAEPRGSSRSDTANILDLRFEQSFHVGSLSGSRIGLNVDIFNLFNSAAIGDYGRLTGFDYGQPRAIQAPRSARVGVRFIW